MDAWPLKKIADIYALHIRDIEDHGKILFLDTNRGRLALKRSTLEQEELDLEFSICEHLFSQGFIHIARIIPTQSGRAFAQVENQRFLLTTWVNGVQSNFSLPEELELAVRNLGRFHLAARGYSGRVYWQKRKLYGIWPQRFSYRLGNILWYRRCIAARGIRGEFDQLFMSYVDHAILQAKRAVNRLKNGNYYCLSNNSRKMGTICHHDYAYHNILIDPERRVWLVDFDYCILDTPLHDLGSLILRTVKLNNWSLEDAKRILLIYHEEKPLEAGDLEVLFSFMEYPQDFWQLAWARYNEVGMHKPENLLIRLKKLIDSLDARDEFLTQFAKLNSQNFLSGRNIL